MIDAIYAAKTREELSLEGLGRIVKALHGSRNTEPDVTLPKTVTLQPEPVLRNPKTVTFPPIAVPKSVTLQLRNKTSRAEYMREYRKKRTKLCQWCGGAL